MDGFTCIAVIVAAGKGLRMGTPTKKQFLTLSGVPVLIHTLNAFINHPKVSDLVLVVPAADLAYCRELTAGHGITRRLHIVSGGKERQDSVARGLTAAGRMANDPQKTLVMVHDGVRPFVAHDVMDACLERAAQTGACIPALKVSDTIKVVDDQGCVSNTLDRSCLYQAQTPQVFRLDLGIRAFDHAAASGFIGTDEASILEHAGIPVQTVAGSPFNIKLTTPQDLSLAEFILGRNLSDSPIFKP